MKKFFIVYGHYDDNSFNAAIKETFIASAIKSGHSVDLVDLSLIHISEPTRPY